MIGVPEIDSPVPFRQYTISYSYIDFMFGSYCGTFCLYTVKRVPLAVEYLVAEILRLSMHVQSWSITSAVR